MAKTEIKSAKKSQVYLWQGLNKRGLKVKGERRSDSITAVKAELRQQGIKPLNVKKKPQPLFSFNQTKIKSADITAFSRQLATMIGAGISIVQALDIVARGNENVAMQKMIFQIKQNIEGGDQLSAALKKHPKYFGSLYCNLIFAGEQSGSLETMLNRLAVYLEKMESLKKKVKKALTYPAAVIVVAIGVTSVLLLYVIPQFEEVFQGFGADLPALTQMVVDLSKILQQWWWIVLLAVIAVIVLIVNAIKRSEKFALKFDAFLLRLPVLGNILQKAIIARYTRTLAITFSAGMPLVTALETVAGAAGNRVYSNVIEVIASQVSTGISLEQAMTETNMFPNLVNQMIAIGEESGALDDMLNKVAEYYDEIVDSAVSNLSTLLEPIIMVILAVIIGGIIIAMYLPIFQIGAAI